MSAAGLDFSVIICAYTDERWQELCQAVRSVETQTLPPREIIVVIDHNAGLLARGRAALPGAQVIENAGPRGLSGARNSGVTAASGAIIAFLDDDAAAAPDWLARLAARYGDPVVIGVGGAINPVWATARPAWFPEEFDWVVGCSYRGLPRETAAVRNLIGANMSFRRQVFAAIGGFRSEIGRVGQRPLGCEETEFCIRAGERFRGSTFIYEPLAQVQHHVPAGRARWSYFRRRSHAEGLSKAQVSRFVGSRAGLASERSYTLHTLPAGIARGMQEALFHHDFSGLLRAGTIVAGLTMTGLGYVGGRLRQGE